jgi:cobalamin biosynthesis Mg chelatase CobN
MIKICFLLVLIITVGTSSVISTNFHAYAVEAIWRDYENMKDLVNDIKNGDKDDDNMDWDKFRDSTVYKDEDEDVRDCIDLANKVGEKLGDYEVVRCFENASYFKEKYSGNAGSQNQSQGNVSQQQQVENQSQGNVSQQQQVENQSQSQGNVSQQQQVENQSQSQGNVSQQQQDENQSQGQEEVSSSESSTNSSDSCDSSYPDVCITTYSAILTCFDIPYRNFKVLAPDRHGFDSDGDGIGCEG